MRAPTEEEMLKALAEAYNLGYRATLAVNFGRKGFTKTMYKKERATINRILKRFGGASIAEEEHDKYFK